MTATLTAPRRTAPAAAPGWDTEVLIIIAPDRPALAARARAVAEAAESDPGFSLAGMAAELAAGFEPAGSVLAVVAGSPADLATKLRRAVGRIADPECQQVRDTNGIYFFARPLALEGSVALLFPGEGAQYLGMLADLCGIFPEVEETFAWSDQLAADAGLPDASLRRLLHLPADATDEQKADAEAELRKLGPSILGVLLADLAIVRVLHSLRIPVAAIAGHSAGEIAALLAAGAMDSEAVLGPRLAEIMGTMQQQEDESGGPDVTLLAVGAGRGAVEELAAGAGVIVAMDNCPHQCVAVGPTPAVARVEAALTDRGVICERLPFRRPYHTPLFEPWMGPFREMFAPVPFAAPHTPVYSCSTGQLFPTDPDEVRDLFVNHWVSPVAFTTLVRRMHADGVRIFVEAGPRGNLSAFAEDILRGERFAAIPANLPRKSGPTQINHLVAQLAAHHVPVNAAHLHAVRGPRAHPPVATESPRAGTAWTEAMTAYLGVMEQFLDVQREVMESFLAGCPAGTLGALEARWSPDPPAGTDLPQEVAAEKPYCLVGDIIRLEPGHEVVFRRLMDEREDRHADDHTLGGRGVSRVNPAQNGLPVLPMTFSLEAMAEAALLLAPGKVVTTLRGVRLFRWLPFDPDPTTLEVRAAVTAVDPETGAVEVKADVRDLGNSFLADAAGKPACEATLILSDRYPEPPEPLPFALTDEQPCRSSVEDLRRNMFHGPLFQMIRSLGRVGREGIEGTLEVQSRDGWFASDPEPRVALDPVLVDAAMHILGAWHLEQPDWTGRILLPIGVNRLDFYGPPPPVGSLLRLRGHNEEETARQVRHGVELFGPDGRTWFRMSGAGYWRFYLPFGNVNFFGPKDEYYLSTRVEGAEAGGGRCFVLEPPADLQHPVLRASGVRVTMSEREQTAYQGVPEAEKTGWFFPRLLAKDAARSAFGARHGRGIFPADLETDVADGRYMLAHRSTDGGPPLPPVTVAVANGRVAAFAAFAERVGVALDVLPKKATAADEQAARGLGAVRAIADALGIDPAGVTVKSLDGETGEAVVSLPPAAAASYPELRGGIRVRTARHQDMVVAATTAEPA
ncbi:MAG TPA: polyketide synthase dehydratase domain-containing protein [Urbifossiella sp.]|nr:polyketide synthase dehydratase domain-containing protein [Urbifossiella sp.]